MSRPTRLHLTLLVMLLATLPSVAAAAQDVPMPRPRPVVVAAPLSFAEAVAGLDLDVAAVTSELSACRAGLDAVALAEPLPRLIGPGQCGGSDMVRMRAIRLPDNGEVTINPPVQLRCTMASAFAHFVRDELAVIFRGRGIHKSLRSIDGTGSYECRGRNRIVGAKVSEHGKGNALDIHSVTFADGSALFPTDLLADKALRETLRAAACTRFATVLGPGSDGYYEEHVHLDLAERRNGFKMCQWNVLTPVTAGPVPLPRPRPSADDPAEADPPGDSATDPEAADGGPEAP